MDTIKNPFTLDTSDLYLSFDKNFNFIDIDYVKFVLKTCYIDKNENVIRFLFKNIEHKWMNLFFKEYITLENDKFSFVPNANFLDLFIDKLMFIVDNKDEINSLI